MQNPIATIVGILLAGFLSWVILNVAHDWALVVAQALKIKPVVLGIITFVGLTVGLSYGLVPGVTAVYHNLKTQLIGNEMVVDAESGINWVASLFGKKANVGWLSGVVVTPGPLPTYWPTPTPTANPTATFVPGQPTPTPGPTKAAQVQDQVVQPPNPTGQLLPSDQLGRCWLEASVKAGIQSASGGATSWFPPAVSCGLTSKKGFGIFYKNEFWVTCPRIGVTNLRITRELGTQLEKIAGDTGSFYGSGEWPPNCYVSLTPIVAATSTPQPESIQQTPTPTSVPTPTVATVIREATLRECPKTDCSELVRLQPGDSVMVLETREGETVLGEPRWAHIRTTSEKDGWVHWLFLQH